MACPFPFTSLTAVNAGCAGCLSSPQNPQKKPLHQSASVYAAELTLGAPFHQSDSLCRPITRQTAPRGRLKINLHFFSPALVASRHHKTHKKNSAPIIETYSNMKTNQNDVINDQVASSPLGYEMRDYIAMRQTRTTHFYTNNIAEYMV